jgi:hypothetical protein
MEIHSAVGGKESMLFAHEVFLMYRNLAYNNGWDFNDTDYSSDEKGRNNFITSEVMLVCLIVLSSMSNFSAIWPPAVIFTGDGAANSDLCLTLTV